MSTRNTKPTVRGSGQGVVRASVALTLLSALGCVADTQGDSTSGTDAAELGFATATANGPWSFDEKDVKASPDESWFDGVNTEDERTEIIAAYEENAREALRQFRRDGMRHGTFAPVCVEIDAQGNETVRDSTLGHRLTVGNGTWAECSVFADMRVGETAELTTGQHVCVLGELDVVSGVSERGLSVETGESSNPNRPTLRVESASGAPVEVRQAVALGAFCSYPIRAQVHYKVTDVVLTDAVRGCTPFVAEPPKPIPSEMCVIDKPTGTAALEE